MRHVSPPCPVDTLRPAMLPSFKKAHQGHRHVSKLNFTENYFTAKTACSVNNTSPCWGGHGFRISTSGHSFTPTLRSHCSVPNPNPQKHLEQPLRPPRPWCVHDPDKPPAVTTPGAMRHSRSSLQLLRCPAFTPTTPTRLHMQRFLLHIDVKSSVPPVGLTFQ